MNADTRNPYYELNAYRKAVLSRDGPAKSGERLVLLALSSFAQPGGIAWPSQRLLAERCNLCVRSLRPHLASLANAHWISRYLVRREGRAWYYTMYMLHTPAQWEVIAACLRNDEQITRGGS